MNLGGIQIDVIRKDIKNVHLSVLPPDGKVRLSAPKRMRDETLRAYTLTRLPWIRQQQRKLAGQPRETRRDYLPRESHYVWGERCLLKIVEADAPLSVSRKHKKLVLQVRPGTDRDRRAELLAAWYRTQIRERVDAVLPEWERRLKVRMNVLFVQHMRTKWGSCNPTKRNVRLNTELAKKPPECLEYILVHELIHMIEPTHNERFVRLISKHMPDWRSRRDLLNALPVAHEDWGY